MRRSRCRRRCSTWTRPPERSPPGPACALVSGSDQGASRPPARPQHCPSRPVLVGAAVTAPRQHRARRPDAPDHDLPRALLPGPRALCWRNFSGIPPEKKNGGGCKTPTRAAQRQARRLPGRRACSAVRFRWFREPRAAPARPEAAEPREAPACIPGAWHATC